MRRLSWAAVIAAAVLPSSGVAAEPGCDGACEVQTLGWHVIDPGPPLRFRTSDGARLHIEVAVADLVRPTAIDGITWAKAQVAGGQGGFGPLGACRGNMPAGPGKTTLLTCAIGAAPEGPRQAGIFVIESTAGVQVIGMIMPASVKQSDFNYAPLQRLASLGDDSGAVARAARGAIAMCARGDFYTAPDAGAGGPEIDAVYHFWNRHATPNNGVVDDGADFVLFKNGEVWRNPGAGPRDIDPVKFKEARWTDWGTWHPQAGGILITLNGQAPTLMQPGTFQRYQPESATGQRVEGQWRWLRTTETPNVLVNSEQVIRLHADGRFELNASTGAIGLPDWSRPGLPRMPGTPGARLRRTGHYRLDGYTLDLTYDQGGNSSNLFYWAGDGGFDRHAMFLLNGVSWQGGLAR